MDLLRHRSFRLVWLLLAFFLVGDIVADGIHDASGACATESQQPSGHDECPACAQCTIHSGAALSAETVSFITPAAEASGRIVSMDDHAAPGAPPAIDHPPQLA